MSGLWQGLASRRGANNIINGFLIIIENKFFSCCESEERERSSAMQKSNFV